MKRTLARIAAGLCIALAVFFLLPALGGILHFGMLWPAAVLLLAAAVSSGRTSSAACCGPSGCAGRCACWRRCAPRPFW